MGILKARQHHAAAKVVQIRIRADMNLQRIIRSDKHYLAVTYCHGLGPGLFGVHRVDLARVIDGISKLGLHLCQTVNQ